MHYFSSDSPRLARFTHCIVSMSCLRTPRDSVSSCPPSFLATAAQCRVAKLVSEADPLAWRDALYSRIHEININSKFNTIKFIAPLSQDV